jgi:hypothetical protein
MYYDEKLLYTEAAYKAGNWTTAGIRVSDGRVRGFLSLSWWNNLWRIEIYSENGCAKIADHYITNYADAKKLFLDIYTAFYHAIENEYIG